MAVLKDYYSILSVKPSAYADEIKRSYRKLAMKYHPDKNPDDKIAAMVFSDIMEAYGILKEAEKRKVYDYKRVTVYGNNTSARNEKTANSILEDASKLTELVASSDRFRLNRDALFVQLKHIIDSKNTLLLNELDDSTINLFIENVLYCCKPLNYKQSTEICRQFLVLTKEYSLAEEKVSLFLKAQLRTQKWEDNKVIVAIIFALVICLLMFFLYR